MYKKLLEYLRRRPDVYEAGTARFWDDAHISKGMLEAHLNPDLNSATRKLDFVRRSAEWIAGIADPEKRPYLLDLGCGPGIYAGLFYELGFSVTGIDLSPRSIDYARERAAAENKSIEYRCMNYLDMDFDSAFDVVTLIFCDFGVLSGDNRRQLLKKIHRALKANGLLIFDVCAPSQYAGREEESTWSYSQGGFWSEKPYACLYSFLRYGNTIADRFIVVEADDVRCYTIWNHIFSTEELEADLTETGFSGFRFFGDIAGAAFTEKSEAICTIAVKQL